MFLYRNRVSPIAHTSVLVLLIAYGRMPLACRVLDGVLARRASGLRPLRTDFSVGPRRLYRPEHSPSMPSTSLIIWWRVSDFTLYGKAPARHAVTGSRARGRISGNTLSGTDRLRFLASGIGRFSGI